MRLFAPAAAALICACVRHLPVSAAAWSRRRPSAATAPTATPCITRARARTTAVSPCGWTGRPGAGGRTAPRRSERSRSAARCCSAAERGAAGCKLGPNPDRRCSPGAVLQRADEGGHLLAGIPHELDPQRAAVGEVRGRARVRDGAAYYGRTLEIDHIVSLELGGSNDIANLSPERATAEPGYHVKDRLENSCTTWSVPARSPCTRRRWASPSTGSVNTGRCSERRPPPREARGSSRRRPANARR